MKANTLNAAKGAISVAKDGVSLAMDASRAGWKKVALAVAVSAGVYGVYEIVQATEEAKSDAKRAEYIAELRDFVDRSCGQYDVFDVNYSPCWHEASKTFKESRRK